MPAVGVAVGVAGVAELRHLAEQADVPAVPALEEAGDVARGRAREQPGAAEDEHGDARPRQEPDEQRRAGGVGRTGRRVPPHAAGRVMPSRDRAAGAAGPRTSGAPSSTPPAGSSSPSARTTSSSGRSTSRTTAAASSTSATSRTTTADRNHATSMPSLVWSPSPYGIDTKK